MMRFKLFLFCVVCALLLPVGAMSAPKSKSSSGIECEWKLLGEEEGIKTYSSCKENSPITQFRSVAILDFPIEVLLEVLADVPSYPKWMPDVIETTVLKEFHNGIERGNFYVHVIYDSQWPVEDRDVVLETIPKTDWNKGVSIVTLRKLHNYAFPEKKNLIRMRELDSAFKFEYIERNKTMVTFTTFVDIGGLISPKLARLQAEPVPYETLEGLTRIAKDKKYFEAAAKEYY